MKILKTQVLRGPNVWSNYRKNLIQVKLDLEEMEQFPTDAIPGFGERLEKLLPSLVEHTCSEGCRGGFFTRVKRGTWLGHVMEHIALEIQTLAGMNTGYGRTRGTAKKGVYNLVFSYEVEEAGLYAAEASFNIITALCSANYYNLEEDIEELKRLYRKYGLGPSTKSIVEEAQKRNIPWRRLNKGSAVQFGYGSKQKRIVATMTSETSARAVEIACDKAETKSVLSQAGIPVAAGDSCTTEAGMFEIIDEIGYPIVIKPIDGNHGKGASINVKNEFEARLAFDLAQRYGTEHVVERFVEGSDFRILVVDHKFVAASRRVPAFVTGDGLHTIAELVELTNADPRRGDGHEAVLTKITIDQDSEALLSKLNYTLEITPTLDERIYLKSTANLSTGGISIDVTDEVCPENRFMAERISKLVGLDICGIDILAQDLSKSLQSQNGVILEVNAAPGFRMHTHPSEGTPRNVASAVVDMMFPGKHQGRIPLIAITGTNGKTTTTRLVAHAAKTAGCKAGYTTTDGIYIDGHLVQKGDTTGPISAQAILNDPMVDFAVLETARGGILRSGLAYNECDVAVLTNIKEDHLGLNDIETIDDLAQVKAVVVRSVKKSGYAVINADDEQCVKIASELDCNIAYFTLDDENILFKKHIENGGSGATLSEGGILLFHKGKRFEIADVNSVPLTLDGKCYFMISNVLAASLASFLGGIGLTALRNALISFYPEAESTPGRMNQFDFSDFGVLVDYAHNPDGYAAVGSYLEHIKNRRKIGIISGVGDRRDEDLIKCGYLAAGMFDKIIIKQDMDTRDRTADQINALVIQGIMDRDPSKEFEVLDDEAEAVKYAISTAMDGDLIVALLDQYQPVLDMLAELKKDIRLAQPSRLNVA